MESVRDPRLRWLETTTGTPDRLLASMLTGDQRRWPNRPVAAAMSWQVAFPPLRDTRMVITTRVPGGHLGMGGPRDSPSES
jgi:hypothetical protein